jgi:hypothetical protein
MLGEKQYLASELIEEQAVVFLLVEEENFFTRQLVTFFQDCGLDVQPLLLSAFADAKQAQKQYQKIKKTEIYKLVFVGGFKDNFLDKPDFVLQVVQALEKTFAEETRVLPILFLLNYSSPVFPVNFKLNHYETFWSRQNLFINRILKKFSTAQFCLLEDYIDLEFDLSLKFNLSFSLFKQQLLVDNQGDCFWQSQEGLFQTFKKIFFQSKPGEKFLLRGKKTSSTDFLLKAQDLCGRYFLENFNILKLFPKNDDKKPLLVDFVRIYQSNDSIIDVLDQKIRQLPLSLNPQFILNNNDLQALKEQEKIVVLPSKTDSLKESKKPETAINKSPDDEVALGTKANKQASSAQVVKKEIKNEDKNQKNIDKSIDIDKKLQTIFRSEQKERQDERFSKNLKGARKIVKKSKYRRLSFYFGMFLASVGSFVLMLFLNFYITQKLFEKNLLTTLQQAVEHPDSASTIILNNKKYSFFKWQLLTYQKIFGDDFLSTPYNYWQIFVHINQVQELAKDLENQFFNFYQTTLASDSNPMAEWSDLLLKKEKIYQQKQELSRLLDQLNPDILPEKQASILAQYKTQLLKEIRIEQRAMVFAEAFSELLLSPARTSIVVLIQDSNELRSSGGFLSSLATLSFENGQLLNWQVHNVADLDQRVYGDKEISEELKNLLLTDKLLLRDANWPADFTESGANISWFIEQSLSLKPDLILSLNSKELYALLTPLFPIAINNIELNQNNFFEELLRQENLDFNDLNKVFFDRLLKVSPAELISIFRQLLLALESRETFLYTANAELSTVLKNNLWSGELLDTPCPSDFAMNDICFTDGIYQLENNVGLNKINRLITQKIDHSLGISENFIRHKRVINLENHSRQNFWPEGDYQTYLKFYLPKTARLEKITLNGEVVSQDTYRWFEEQDRRVLAYRLVVPLLSSSTLELVYLVPHELKAPFSYVFLDQKQPGIFNKETQYKVLFSEVFQPNLIAPQANYENKVIEFNNTNQDNFLFAVAF